VTEARHARPVANDAAPGELERDGADAPARSAFVPILLTSLAVACSLAFQTVQLVRERRQLETLQASLLLQEQASLKLRASLDAVATATARLATQGNANARTIVEQLRNRGITIDPSKATKPP
jgi:hypothetical protein